MKLVNIWRKTNALKLGAALVFLLSWNRPTQNMDDSL